MNAAPLHLSIEHRIHLFNVRHARSFFLGSFARRASPPASLDRATTLLVPATDRATEQRQ